MTRVPDHSHDIIIGQTFPSGTTPFAMLHYQSSKVYGFIHGQSQEYVLATGIPLGASFTDSIKASGDTVTFSVTYQQDTTGQAASDGGRLTFSALSETGVS